MRALIERRMQRAPDFVIGTPEAPYMLRWWAIPRNKLFNIYLHRFLRDDDDRALHDHPWVNVSIVVAGGYWEIVPTRGATTKRVWRAPGSMTVRGPRSAHRVELDNGAPATTIFITGPRVRTWGFWCPKGWVRWTDFVKDNQKGEVGLGCDATPVTNRREIASLTTRSAR